MDAYIYQADIYCADCGEQIALDLFGMTPEDANMRETYDSNDCPQGPYPDGGGEADTPQHCDACGLFLENPLTDDGIEYVRESISRFNLDQSGDANVINDWREFYSTVLQ